MTEHMFLYLKTTAELMWWRNNNPEQEDPDSFYDTLDFHWNRLGWFERWRVRTKIAKVVNNPLLTADFILKWTRGSINYLNGKWYFYTADEDICGPFDTMKECKKQFRSYCASYEIK